MHYKRKFEMKITWLAQGGFLFESSGTRILIDPYMSDCLEFKGLKRMVEFPLSLEELKPDMLICTHDHLDHLDPETVSKIARFYPNCIIAGPESCCEHFRKLEIPEPQIKLLATGTPCALDDIKLTPVLAIHTAPDAIGIVLELEGKKVYLSADTEYDAGLVNDLTANSDLVIICINGRLGNMSLEDALKVVTAIKPATALPTHYGLFAANTADPQPFIDYCNKNGIDSFELYVGKPICY
jgi:L-ascorbate metabolism protein UlaG (beta-lactamase superfamily)